MSGAAGDGAEPPAAAGAAGQARPGAAREHLRRGLAERRGVVTVLPAVGRNKTWAVSLKPFSLGLRSPPRAPAPRRRAEGRGRARPPEGSPRPRVRTAPSAA